MSAPREPLRVDRGDWLDRFPFTIGYLALLLMLLVSVPPGWLW